MKKIFICIVIGLLGKVNAQESLPSIEKIISDALVDSSDIVLFENPIQEEDKILPNLKYQILWEEEEFWMTKCDFNGGQNISCLVNHSGYNNVLKSRGFVHRDSALVYYGMLKERNVEKLKFTE